MNERFAYLEHIKIDRFGRFTDKAVGPFSPGLNVVYGRNEAGKTTLTSFVKGVLFGWEDARANKNVYKSQAGSRSGTLFFRETDFQKCARGEESFEFTRVKNADGLQAHPDRAAGLFSDIDKETFSTMFFLTSDELRGLSANTVTAKLLTAGSGTGCSPADALAALDERIATYTSKSAGAPHSLRNLKAAIDDCRVRQAECRAQADALRSEDREFAELEHRRENVFSEISQLNERISQLSRAYASVEEVLIRHRSRRADLQQMSVDRREAEAAMETYRANHPDVRVISAVEERSLRDRLSELDSRKQAAAAQEASARDAFADASAREQALLDGDWAIRTAHRIRRQRLRNRVLAFVLPAIFLLAALVSVWQSVVTESVFFVAAAVACALASVGFGAAGLYLLFRPDRSSAELEIRRREAHEKTAAAAAYLESCRLHRVATEDELHAFLDESGLSDAAGSAITARAILDAAADMRATRHAHDDGMRRIKSSRELCSVELGELTDRYRSILDGIGIAVDAEDSDPDPCALESISALIDEAAARRDDLQLVAESESRRYGELKQKLADGLRSDELDRIKVERAQLNTRFDESRTDLACLLLARALLADSIEAWEGKSQPEVYARASRLFEMMTDGVWTEIRMGEDGTLTVKDAVHNVREPKYLSLGTCQQLYLAMRIALLISARNVGRSVPVLADDILVNFDGIRRRGAVAALAELARHRQVIVFTCHEEIVELFNSVAPARTLIEL